MTKKTKKAANTTSKKKITKSATKIKAAKTKMPRTEEVAKALDIQGPVIVFPEKEVHTVLTINEYKAMLGTLGNASVEDKAFYRRFKFSLDKNSKVLHAVSIEPCLSLSSQHPMSVNRLLLPDIEAFFKIKGMSKEWMNRHMVENMRVYQTQTMSVWSFSDPLVNGDIYRSSAFDIIFKSKQAAKKYLDMLKTLYRVRITTTV